MSPKAKPAPAASRSVVSVVGIDSSGAGHELAHRADLEEILAEVKAGESVHIDIGDGLLVEIVSIKPAKAAPKAGKPEKAPKPEPPPAKVCETCGDDFDRYDEGRGDSCRDCVRERSAIFREALVALLSGMSPQLGPDKAAAVTRSARLVADAALLELAEPMPTRGGA